jgi:hypothetical protein
MAQTSGETTWPDSIPNGLTDAESQGDLEVASHSSEAANADAEHHGIGASQGSRAIECTDDVQ